MDQASLGILLRHARDLAAYAMRNGHMRPAGKIFELTAALEATPAPAEEAALTAQLYAEMDGLAKTIPPAKLRQWGWRQSASRYGRRFWASLPRFLLGSVTLLLTFYLAFQSSQLHQADTALRAYDEWVAQQPKEKLYAAFKMYRYERVLNVTQPPLAQLDAYQKLVDDAHQQADKGAAIAVLLQEASRLLYVPPVLANWGVFKGITNRLNMGTLDPDALARAKEQGELRKLEETPGANGTIQAPPVDCKAATAPPSTSVKAARQPPTVPAADIDAYESSWSCFLIRLGVDQQQLVYSPWPVIYETRSKVNMLMTWLLPGLYGLLGACVYLMRDMLRSPDDRLDPANPVLHNLSLLLRIALGGLAGIIIGWFSVPASITSGAAAPPISSIPFGVAFLAGFSIETLFSLLDRLNKTLIEARDVKTP